MTTRGYHSYHGRMSAGKRVTIFLLVLVLVLAVAYLVAQHFVVFDDMGGARFQWPFASSDDADGAGDPAYEHDELELIVDESGESGSDPAAPQGGADASGLAPITGLSLTAEPAQADSEGQTFALTMKDELGRLTYPSALVSAKGAGAVVGEAAAGERITELLADDTYGIARVSAVRDNYYSLHRLEMAGLTRETRYPWRAFDAAYYLDPAKSTARSYIAAVAEECVAYGFDEVALSHFGYPAEGAGRLYRIDYPADTRSAVRGFLETVGGAVRRSGAVFSVELESAVILAGGAEEQGVYLEDVLAVADRVYVETTEEEAAAIRAAIGESADFVAVFDQAPSAAYQGSYLVKK